MNGIEKIHGGYVEERRVRVLSEILSRHIPRDARVLDVGAGDGRMALAIQQKRRDLDLRGVDVHVRANTHVPVTKFDGKNLPDTGPGYDVVMFVDVLHHAEDPFSLIKEAARVARRAILIKDHIANGPIAYQTLKFMDKIGNQRYGVALPYNYWREEQWRHAFSALGLTTSLWVSRLGIYPWPASLLFDRKLHFVAVLENSSSQSQRQSVAGEVLRSTLESVYHEHS